MGVSGRAMMRAILAGESDPVRWADLAHRRFAPEASGSIDALNSRVTGHHRFLLERLPVQVELLGQELRQSDQRVADPAGPPARQRLVGQLRPAAGRRVDRDWLLLPRFGHRFLAAPRDRVGVRTIAGEAAADQGLVRPCVGALQWDAPADDPVGGGVSLNRVADRPRAPAT